MRPSPSMASGILGAFVRHRNAANLFMLLLIIFGAWGVSKLNRQLMPTIATHNINISIIWSGATAADIEKNILTAVEPVVRYLDGVQSTTSRVAEGSANITLAFDRGTDLQDAKVRVDNAVQSVQNLPEGAEDIEVTSQKFFDPVASVGLSGPFPEATLRGYARQIRDGLLAAGVDRVTMVGYRDREITIDVKEARLRQLGLTLADISNVLNANITDQPAGALEGDFDARIRAVATSVTASELAGIEIRSAPNGNAIYLGDIATVTDTFDSDDALGFMRGVPAIRLMVSRTAAADTITSFEAIKAYVAEITPTLPPSLEIIVFDAAASLVDDRLSLLISNGTTGLVIVLFVLFLFLEPRVAFWVAAGIPISVLATLGVMYLTGQTINMISMFALMMTLGIIVDDAIVVGEHTATRYAAGDTPALAATRGASRMAAPVIAASLTTMAAFGPILLVGDVIGQIMAALPLVVLAVLVASGVECFFILPGHLAHALPKQRKRPGWFRRRFDAGFAWFREHVVGALSDLSYHLRYATVALALGVAILSGALVASGQLRFQFFPSAEGESFNVFASFQPGIPQQRMRAIIARIEGAVSQVERDLAPAGEKLVLTTYASLDLENSGASFNVYLTPSEQRTVRTSAIAEALRQAIPSVAGVERMGVREQRGGPQGRAIDVKFSGADTATLKKASEDLQGVLEGYAGVNSISDTLAYGSPELVLALTPRGRALGFDLAGLGVQVSEAFQGRTVRKIATEQEEITLRLKRVGRGLGSAALREMSVRAPGGAFVPLSSVVTFDERQTFDRIRREEAKSVVSVRADTDDTVNTGDIITQLTANDLPVIAERYGVTFELGGRRAERDAAFADLGVGALMALGIMYIIIAWIFQSYTIPFAVMLVIPFGAAGAIWGHYLLGFDLTIISLMGLLGLGGILVNDSIVLISRLQERMKQGDSLRLAATGAARDRLRAVLLTSLTTIGGLMPLLFETSLQAQFLIPMAITMVFGLGLATLLVLFLVPAFIGIGADIGALLGWVFLTRTGPTFRQLLAGDHHDRPGEREGYGKTGSPGQA